MIGFISAGFYHFKVVLMQLNAVQSLLLKALSTFTQIHSVHPGSCQPPTGLSLFTVLMLAPSITTQVTDGRRKWGIITLVSEGRPDATLMIAGGRLG